MIGHCPECDSINVYVDAYVNVNDSTNVRTYDQLWCEDCESYPNYLNYKETP